MSNEGCEHGHRGFCTSCDFASRLATAEQERDEARRREAELQAMYDSNNTQRHEVIDQLCLVEQERDRLRADMEAMAGVAAERDRLAREVADHAKVLAAGDEILERNKQHALEGWRRLVTARKALEDVIRLVRQHALNGWIPLAMLKGTLKSISADTPSTTPACAACGAVLLPKNAVVADGCPCNSKRGINHGIVATDVCTCVECDPAQTGASRRRECPD